MVGATTVLLWGLQKLFKGSGIGEVVIFSITVTVLIFAIGLFPDLLPKTPSNIPAITTSFVLSAVVAGFAGMRPSPKKGLYYLIMTLFILAAGIAWGIKYTDVAASFLFGGKILTHFKMKKDNQPSGSMPSTRMLFVTMILFAIFLAVGFYVLNAYGSQLIN